MNNAVILHGKPPRERYDNPNEPKPHEANWFPWLGQQLIERGVEVSIPPLPKPYYPVYKDWKGVFDSNKVDQETALIGHSAGAEFILRWLSENQIAEVEQVVIIAPYRDYENKYGDFSQYKLDKDIVKRTDRLTIMYSLDDDEPILRRTRELITAFPSAEHIELNGFGHFRIGHNMQTDEFPELLNILKNA